MLAIKDTLAHEDAAARLRHVIDELRSRDSETQRRESIAALEQRQLSAEEELQVLNELVSESESGRVFPHPRMGSCLDRGCP